MDDDKAQPGEGFEPGDNNSWPMNAKYVLEEIKELKATAIDIRAAVAALPDRFALLAEKIMVLSRLAEDRVNTLEKRIQVVESRVRILWVCAGTIFATLLSIFLLHLFHPFGVG